MALQHDEVVCPRCGEEMERGYLLARAPGIRWGQSRAINAAVFTELMRERLSATFGYWRQSKLDAARCTRCHIGTFSYEERARARAAW